MASHPLCIKGDGHSTCASKGHGTLYLFTLQYLILLLLQTGEVLLKKHHEATPEIQKRVNSLIVKWNELLQASSERGKGLEEAKDILKFNEEVEKVEDWIREKVWELFLCFSAIAAEIKIIIKININKKMRPMHLIQQGSELHWY